MSRQWAPERGSREASAGGFSRVGTQLAKLVKGVPESEEGEMVERKVPRRNAPGQGRPKRPTNLRVVDGGVRARPTEPQPDERRVVMPAGMSAGGQRIWKRLAPGMIRLGVLTFWDVDTFRIYWEVLSQVKEARALVDDHGLLVPSRGGLVMNSAVRIERDQMRPARSDALGPQPVRSGRSSSPLSVGRWTRRVHATALQRLVGVGRIPPLEVRGLLSVEAKSE